MEDLTALSDAQLEERRKAITAEVDRRLTLAQLPLQMQELRARYQEFGGDPADLEP